MPGSCTRCEAAELLLVPVVGWSRGLLLLGDLQLMCYRTAGKVIYPRSCLKLEWEH